MVAPIIIPSLQKNPIEAWQRAGIMERRYRTDWAEQLNKRVDEDFPVSEKTVLVMDNLNTHAMGSRYGLYPAG